MKDLEITRSSLWRGILTLLIAGALGCRFLVARNRYFNPDEIQHLHGGFSIAHGLVPFRDYFEHHTPWLPYLLSWIYPIHADTLESIFFARYLMIVFTIATVLLTYFIAARLHGRDVGLLAALMLSVALPFMEKSLEVRPDVPQTTLWLAGLAAAMAAIRSQEWRWYGVSGLLLGSTIMFSQKGVIGVAGVCAAIAWACIDRCFDEPVRQRLQGALVFALGLMAPFLATCLQLLAAGALAEFIDYNFVLNATWTSGYAPLRIIEEIAQKGPLVFTLGLGGLILAVVDLSTRRDRRDGSIVVVAGALALVAGIWVVPMLFLQYFQPLLPLWCIFAASLLWRVFEIPGPRALASRWRQGGVPWQHGLWIVVCLASILLLWGLLPQAYSFLVHKRIYFAATWKVLALCMPLAWLPAGWQRSLGFAVVLGLGALLTPLDRLGAYFVAPVLLLCMLAVGLEPRRLVTSLVVACIVAVPIWQLRRDSTTISNESSRQEIALVHRLTSVSDPVFSGWWDSVPFRPHVYEYFFLHQEMRSMLTREQLGSDIVRALRVQRPRVVIYDRAVLALEPEVKRYIHAHYRPTRIGVIWLRKDLGERRRSRLP